MTLRTVRDVVEFSGAFTAIREETDALETDIIHDWQPLTNRYNLYTDQKQSDLWMKIGQMWLIRNTLT